MKAFDHVLWAPFTNDFFIKIEVYKLRLPILSGIRGSTCRVPGLEDFSLFFSFFSLWIFSRISMISMTVTWQRNLATTTANLQYYTLKTNNKILK